MSKLLIDSKLLERLQERLDPHLDAVDWGLVCDAFRAARPAPESVGGVEAINVVGVRVTTDGFGSYIADSAMGVPAAMPGEVREQLMTVAQHNRILAATVPAGCKVVPVERIAIALEAVQSAMEDAYNNAYQDCCGRGQGECCGNPVAAWSDADQAIMDALAPAQRQLSALITSAILEVKP